VEIACSGATASSRFLARSLRASRGCERGNDKWWI
jgi:hypothetical protein